MKRLVRNGIYLAIILIVALLAFNFYSPKESPIAGATISERVEQIRARVDGRDYISVSDGRREEMGGIVVVRYQFTFTAPMKIFLEAQNYQVQGRLGLTYAAELEKAINSYRSALFDLFRLTMKYVIPFDPAVRAIIVEIRLPDGSMQRAIGFVEELKVLPDNTSPQVLLEKVHFLDLKLIPAETNVNR